MVEVGTRGSIIQTTPSGALKVNIRVFEGPIDLLLYLIQKHEIDIFDIPIAFITQEYLNYLDLMKELNLDIAGDFVLMAAMLTKIKSAMLLPQPEGQEEVLDPREELVRRLLRELDYRRYKDAAQELEKREMLGIDVFTHPAAEVEAAVSLAEEKINTTLFELLTALKAVLDKLPEKQVHEVTRESISIKVRILQLIERLRGHERLEFVELFEGVKTRPMVIITFLSLLELMKLRLVKCQQASPVGPIHIFPIGDLDGLQSVEVEEYSSEVLADES